MHPATNLTAEAAAELLRELRHTMLQKIAIPGSSPDPKAPYYAAALTRALKSLRTEPDEQSQLPPS